MPTTQTAISAPKVPNGRASITDSGSDQRSYSAARIKNTMITARPKAIPVVPELRFSWNAEPVHS